MSDEGVAVLLVLCGYLPGFRRDFIQRDPRFKKGGVVKDSLVGDTVHVALACRGFAGPAVIGAGDIRTIAKGADHVGVERYEVSVCNRTVGRFLKPGVRPLARGQQTAFKPFTAVGNVGFRQNRSEPIFRDSRHESIPHADHAVFGDCTGDAHTLDFLVGLDRTGTLDRFLGFVKHKPGVGQG